MLRFQRCSKLGVTGLILTVSFHNGPPLLKSALLESVRELKKIVHDSLQCIWIKSHRIGITLSITDINYLIFSVGAFLRRLQDLLQNSTVGIYYLYNHSQTNCTALLLQNKTLPVP